jgi:drug/metabolite transporter (DMT)-like permease
VIEFSAGHPVLAASAALSAAAVTALGTALQQRATHTAGHGKNWAVMLARLVRVPSWVFSLVLVLAGFGLYLLALSLGTLTLAQPIMISGVVFGSVFSAWLARRRPDRAILAGALLCGVGLALFLAIASPVAPLGAPAALGPRWPLAAAAAVALGCAIAGYTGRGLPRPVGLATATGVLFGLNAALAKLVVQELGHGWAEPLRHWPCYLMLLVAPTGFVLSQQAMRLSRLLAPVNAVISSLDPVTAVAIGVLALGERLRASPVEILGQCIAVLVVVGGIVLVTGRGATLHRAHRGARTKADKGALSWG